MDPLGINRRRRVDGSGMRREEVHIIQKELEITDETWRFKVTEDVHTKHGSSQDRGEDGLVCSCSGLVLVQGSWLQ